MHYMLIIQKVEDYEKWKSIFDENTETRKENGSKEAHVFKSEDNPNEIVILYQWDDLNNARKFFESEDLKNKMKTAGVMGMPDIHFLEGIGKTSA